MLFACFPSRRKSQLATPGSCLKMKKQGVKIENWVCFRSKEQTRLDRVSEAYATAGDVFGGREYRQVQ